MPFLFEQLKFLYFLQQFRNPLIDSIFQVLNFFDTDYFICSLIAFIWIGFSWRWGVRFGYLMIASGLLNAAMKLAFALPRPVFFDSSLGIVKLYDYGFPSGGGQNAVLFACLMIYFWKTRWSWPLGIAYFMIISFSRIFLGVHFPMDVLGGWILGAFLFFAFIKSYRPIELFASRHCAALTVGVVAVALILGSVFRDHKITFLMTSLAVMTIGVYFSTKFKLNFAPLRDRRKKIFLGLFGICSAAILTFFARMVTHDLFFSHILQGIVSGFWISLFASPFCKRFFGLGKRGNK